MAYGGKSGVFAEKVIYIPCIKGKKVQGI